MVARQPLRRSALLVLFVCLVAGTLVESPSAAAASAASGSGTSTAGDFDNDGYDDLAVGTPYEDIDTPTGVAQSAGAVNVVYGSSSGLTGAGDEFWHQRKLGHEPEEYDNFGFAVAAGDFDGDGFDDLAVAALQEQQTETSGRAGVVHVLYGSPTGLRAEGAQLLTQGNLALEMGENGDRFGSALATGDLGKSARDDLAIGISGETVDGGAAGGAVAVVYGGSSGLARRSAQLWHQDSTDADGNPVGDVAEADDAFGDALAIGDFGRSGYDDLAVGVPSESSGVVDRAGAIHVLYGSRSGITAQGERFLTRATPNLEGDENPYLRFGAALVAADFGKSGKADLAVGAPGDRVFEAASGTLISYAGSINVLYGARRGLRVRGDQLWNQNSSGIAEVAEEQDGFGSGLAAGNFGKSGHADLLVGVGPDSVADEGGGEIDGGGVAHAIYGSNSGLAPEGDQLWHQDRSGIEGAVELNDYFGLGTVVAGDFGKGRYADAAVGVAFEDVGPEGSEINEAGQAHILYGRSGGLSAHGSWVLHQGLPSILDEAEQGDIFGAID